MILRIITNDAFETDRDEQFDKILAKAKYVMKNNRSKKRYKISAIDLFCGAGGLTRGLESAGIDVKLGIDIDIACKYPYQANNKAKFLLKAVEDIRPSDIESVFDGCEYRLIAGCAPCQTFSTYNQKANVDDKRWWLLDEFSRIVSEVLPELVTMENVPGMVDYEIFDEFISNLEELGYSVDYNIVNCSEYGVPQNRQRLVLLASMLGKVKLICPSKKTSIKTVRSAIGNLPSIGAGEVCKDDALHQSSVLTGINIQRIKASIPGGTWRDWPKHLVADCHKKRTGKTYPSVYGRMSWDEPSPTITTQFFGFGNGRFGHPEQNRAISIREGAILQTFPRSYKFVEPGSPIHKTTLGRLIGNAVPVKLGEVIGKSLVKHITEIEKVTN